MSAILRVLLFVFLTWPCLAQVPADCRQMVLVVAPGWNSWKGQLQRYQRDHASAPWQAQGDPIEVVLGAQGLAWGLGEVAPAAQGPRKREGDGRAPAGVYALPQLWTRPGIAPPPSGGFVPRAIHPDTFGVDDPKSRFYNRIVEGVPKDWKSCERMDIPDYDRVLVVAHNLDKPRPGCGSCIFVHRWEASSIPTSGCTAMAETDLVTLIDWLRPDRSPRLVQLPQKEAELWNLRGWLPGIQP